MSIANAGVIVDLNISVWTGKKLDREVAAEVDTVKNTRTKAGSYTKSLFAGTDKLEQVTKIAGKIRNWHQKQTLPWSDSGARLLPMANFFEYKHQLAEFEKEFDQAVEAFIAAYPDLITAAAFQIGALFDRDDYPSEANLRRKFDVRYVFSPVPQAGDFRVDSDTETQTELRVQYDKQFKAREKELADELWGRLHEYLTTLAERLQKMEAPKADEKSRSAPFHESHLTNGVELCDILTRLNVTGDPELEQARKDLESALYGVTVKDVRTSDGERARVKQNVQSILEKFNW